MLCNFVLSGERFKGKFVYICTECHQRLAVPKPMRIYAECGVKRDRSQFMPHNPQLDYVQEGVGTELHKLLDKLGYGMLPGCKCEQRIQTMNKRGVEWCEQNVNKIVDWLEESAAEFELLAYEISPRVVWRAVAKRLVKQAIRSAKRV